MLQKRVLYLFRVAKTQGQNGLLRLIAWNAGGMATLHSES
jgi:hypothetical protein